MVNNIDGRDEDGWTALHAAVYWENMEAAIILVKKGASINLVTKTVSGCSFVCGQIRMCVSVSRETQSMTCADLNLRKNCLN